MTNSIKLVLASASPRRRMLLDEAEIEYRVIVAHNIEPEQEVDESPANYARRAAMAKALYVAGEKPGLIVLGADTVVAIQNLTLGKPHNEADAQAMLRQLSGRTHEVHTGVALALFTPDNNLRLHSDVATTRVTFRKLTTNEIIGYVKTGEPLDKAGAYGIQGLGGKLVASISGEWDNVVGLPLEIVHALLKRMLIV